MKRWKSIPIGMLTSVSLIALTACEEPRVDALVFETLEQCLDDTTMSRGECEANYKEARDQHAAVAPKYASEADCMADFGDGRCEKAPYQTQSGGSIFMPLMMGYMMGSMIGGRRSMVSQPLPNHQESGRLPHRRQPECGRGDGPDPSRQIGHQPSLVQILDDFARWIWRVRPAVRVGRRLT